jgi:nucleoid-associated protein YgaU
MTGTSKARIVVPFLVLIAACSAAFVFVVIHERREASVQARAVTAAPAVPPPALGAGDERSASLATAQAEANAVPIAPTQSPRSPNSDQTEPAFDVARIEPTGDAVIAGRARPGATVELLLDGEHHDQAVTDQSGQFVMVPTRLPPGDHQLTLRSKGPDGKQATSKESVVAAVVEAESRSSTVRSRVEVAQAASSSQIQIAKQDASAAMSRSNAGSASAVAERKIATAVVSRGDSLWRISRVTYGAGLRYAVVYKANRGQIRDPDRIYPGQILVLPMKER